jgi:hypothetical protein
MVMTMFLVFTDLSKIFHLHIEAFGITLGNIHAQPSEGRIDHRVYFSN